jgi:hypothetical protein
LLSFRRAAGPPGREETQVDHPTDTERPPYPASMTPETRYARADDVHIAYQLLGE